MIFKTNPIYKTELNMPITAFTSLYVLQPNYIATARWRYVPGEDLDFSRFRNINSLYISAYRPMDIPDHVKICPYRVPALAGLFPNLTQLFITNWDCPTMDCFFGNITDIPSSVREVTLEYTHMGDLGVLNTMGINILSMNIRNTRVPMKMSCALPPRVFVFTIHDTFVTDSIIFSEQIIRVTCGNSRIHKLEGLEKSRDPSLIVAFYNCETPYDHSVITGYHPNSANYKIVHINRVNAELSYQHFASIAEPLDNIRQRAMSGSLEWDSYWKNPINRALHLASNYPRRISEFVANDIPEHKLAPSFNNLDHLYQPQHGHYEDDEDYDDDDEEPEYAHHLYY